MNSVGLVGGVLYCRSVSSACTTAKAVFSAFSAATIIIERKEVVMVPVFCVVVHSGKGEVFVIIHNSEPEDAIIAKLVVQLVSYILSHQVA